MTLRPGWLACLICSGSLVAWPALIGADEPATPMQAPAEQPQAAQPPERLELEEAPKKLNRAPRTEEEKDRLHAAALFAEGRILNQRGKYPEALAKFERAWRYDQDSKPILDEIVPLAMRLNRLGEAGRYAVIAIEKGAKVEPRVLQRLAMELSQNQEWDEALVVYRKLHELQKAGLEKDEEADISLILIHLELGRINFVLGNYRESAEAFALVKDALENPDKYSLNDALRKMVLDDPERTYLLLGDSFVRGGRLDDAEAMFRKADEIKPQPEVLDFRLARVALARGETDKAQQQLDVYLKAKSSLAGSEPYELLSQIIAKTHPEAAEAEAELVRRLEQLYEDDPANAGLAYFTAQKLLDAERLDDAEEILREQLTLNPSLGVYRALIEIYTRQAKPQEVLDVLGQTVAEAGSLDSFEDEVGAIAENEELLTQVLAAANTKNAQDAGGLAEGEAFAVGMVALAGEKWDAADEFLNLAAKGGEPGAATVLTEWGLSLFFAGEHEKAIEIFRRAIDEQVNPENDAAFYFYLANALAFADRPDEALTAALQAQQLRPENPRFESRVAWINYRALRYGDAERGYLELLEKVEEDFSSDEMRELVREARLILSNICVKQDRFDDGVEWLEQVLDEFPRDPGALNDLGYLWSEKGLRPERSLKMVQQAVQAEPDNAAYQDSLGWALFRMGRTDEALTAIEKAVELQGDAVDGVILDHLGDIHLKRNEKEKALDAWRRAAAAFEEDDETDELEKTQKKIQQHE